MKIEVNFEKTEADYETTITFQGDVTAFDAVNVLEGAHNGVIQAVANYLKKHPEQESRVNELTLKELSI